MILPEPLHLLHELDTGGGFAFWQPKATNRKSVNMHNAKKLLFMFFLAPNAGDERAAERRHRQSEGTDAYLPEG